MKIKTLIASLAALLCGFLLWSVVAKEFSLTPPRGGRGSAVASHGYDAKPEIEAALQALRGNAGKATVLALSANGERVVALTFDGLADSASMQRLLALLAQYNVKATFFVDGLQTAEEPQAVADICAAGHGLGNYTLAGASKLEALPAERLVTDFVRAQKIIAAASGHSPSLLKCNNTQYADHVLHAARASGFASVVKSDVFVNVKQLGMQPTADGLVAKLQPGSVVSIKLKSGETPAVNPAATPASPPAIDKQPGLKPLPQASEAGDTIMLAAVEKLLAALQKAQYRTIALDGRLLGSQAETSWLPARQAAMQRVAELFACRTAFAAAPAASTPQEIKTVLTTEPALAFSFGGLSNPVVVDDVLARLQRLGIRATFFVMEVELNRYPAVVEKIIAHGHEVGIGIRPKAGETAEATRDSVRRVQQILQARYGVATNLVKQPWGAVEETAKRGVAEAGGVLIGQSVNVVQGKHKDYETAEQVMNELFGKAVYSLARGQIVHFRMDYYAHERVLGEVMELIKQRKIDNIAFAASYDNPQSNPANDSAYRVKSVGELLSHARFVYQLPIDPARIPAHLQASGAQLGLPRENFLAEATKRYIGNATVNADDRMIGFSKMEMRRLDKSGVIHTERNVVFLTFDDWGTDAAINKLLYVLRKHRVPGAFFIITNNVMNNPNLLRAIATEGHDIGSHSDKHKPMSVPDPKTGRQYAPQSRAEYSRELGLSYQKLLQITGDVLVDGRAPLTRIFRPPTLAVSKMGFEALFENGYEFIVNGSFSTQDYRATGVAELVADMKTGLYTPAGEVRKGAVLVMHMSDMSAYTPVALDILLTANAAKPDDDPSKFVVGRLSDYLVDGYAQMRRR